ncbi:sulfatase-like hydrolase/transferase [Sulfuriroseicoccus oceanibius]|uniref:Sulfatase-like hydrolase/transferase n=1 Tax=Sulfuriroseicoccus oceanibius TaxID=2707525 RepID=A0A6B3L8X1_9BACT|nr:sulfatase-like hydrolase/transferase [Sulfuriroseicoccus oceanibius]QQL45862.1 sulfatase-like hydrolase/transferase [Sulfuriroseicoccus oceanibius]
MMRYVVSAALWLLAQGGVLAGSSVLMDFGTVQGAAGGNWNHLGAGTSLADLVDSSGTATTIDLTLRFHGSGAGYGGGAFNSEDPGAPEPFNVKNAYADGLYSNNHTEAGIDITLSELAPNTSYTITFYGGRNDGNWSDADVTVVVGSGDGGKVTHRAACSFVVTSDSSGGIRLNFVDDGSNVSSGANATLAAMSIEEVPNLLPTIGEFLADDYYVAAGDAVTLEWRSDKATSLVIDQGVGDVTGVGVDGSGSFTVNVEQTTTYTLTAANDEGAVTESVRVVVGDPRPNILFFLVDDMGWQDTSVPFHYDGSGNPVRGVYNDRYRTPSMETLAAQGRKFTNAYAYSICSPTRVSIMTGMHAARHHVTTWTHPETPQHTGGNSVAHLDSPADWRMAGMDAADIPLPKMLKQAGYRTIHAGKAHFGPNSEPSGDPRFLGFDVNIAGHGAGGPGSYLGSQNFSGTWRGAPAFWDVPGLDQYHIGNYGQEVFLTEALTLEMNREIERAVADGVPFFAYMSHYAVHVPWTNDERFTANYDGSEPGEPNLGGQELAFATIVEGVDKSLGDIMARLEQLGVADDTLVIFYSDNGSDLRDGREESVLRGYKGTKWEGAFRVPFIVGWAKLDGTNSFQQALPIPANTRDERVINCEDMFSTVAAVAGVAYDHDVDGYDLSPYFRGVEGELRPQQFIQHFPHGHGSDHFVVMRQGDWKIIHEYSNGTTQLFNLADDVGEATDVADQHPELVMSMTRHLIQELERYGAQYSRNVDTGGEIPPKLPNLPAVDVDEDGVADLTEDANQNGLVDPGETDPDNDNTDGDNVPDGDEARLGTDPLDAASRFDVLPIRHADGSIELRWPSAPGATFTIRSSHDLSDWSTVVADAVPAAGAGAVETSYVFAAGESGRRFFQVELN